MKRKLALSLAAIAGAVAMLVPAASSAAPKTCVVVNGPGGFHLQVGYAPTGPDGCRQLR
jgi:hypothetical protein